MTIVAQSCTRIQSTSVYTGRYTAPLSARLFTVNAAVCTLFVVETAAELLTTEQVMDRLLSDRRLRRLATTCVLPAIREGGEWRFRKSDLDAWIRRQRASFAHDSTAPTDPKTFDAA